MALRLNTKVIFFLRSNIIKYLLIQHFPYKQNSAFLLYKNQKKITKDQQKILFRSQNRPKECRQCLIPLYFLANT